MENESAKISAELPLSEQIIDTREHILYTLTQIEDIELQVNPHVLADYQVKIGVWENRLMEAQIALRREERKVALAQAAINKGATVSETVLDEQLDEELGAWYAQLQSAVAGYQQALQLRTMSEAMSPGDARELKKLYRTLVKRLHPDIHPEDEERAYYFLIAERAYENGDLAALRSLETATTHLEPAPVADEAQSEENLNAELAFLQAQAAVADARLDELLESEPYIFKSLLEDPVWLTQKIAEFKDELAHCTEEQQRCRERFLSLMEEG